RTKLRGTWRAPDGIFPKPTCRTLAVSCATCSPRSLSCTSSTRRRLTASTSSGAFAKPRCGWSRLARCSLPTLLNIFRRTSNATSYSAALAADGKGREHSFGGRRRTTSRRSAERQPEHQRHLDRRRNEAEDERRSESQTRAPVGAGRRLLVPVRFAAGHAGCGRDARVMYGSYAAAAPFSHVGRRRTQLVAVGERWRRAHLRASHRRQRVLLGRR